MENSFHAKMHKSAHHDWSRMIFVCGNASKTAFKIPEKMPINFMVPKFSHTIRKHMWNFLINRFQMQIFEKKVYCTTLHTILFFTLSICWIWCLGEKIYIFLLLSLLRIMKYTQRCCQKIQYAFLHKRYLYTIKCW